MGNENNWLSISEMANTCGISRQTLIYYDKHDIFKPGYVDENGYRYYSLYQIPFLREICALKCENVSLKEIVDNLQERNVDNVTELLISNRENIKKELEDLQRKMDVIDVRLKYYDIVKEAQTHGNTPYLSDAPGRIILFSQWETAEMGRKEMHFTHMRLRRFCNDHDIPIAWGFGAYFSKESMENEAYFTKAGGYINIPKEFEEKLRSIDLGEFEVISLPPCQTVCMCKYGMPYETEHLDNLRQWLKDNGYHVAGPALDECMLDTTFYTDEHQKDFCQIKIPIEGGSL